jgi:hypothetical protein
MTFELYAPHIPLVEVTAITSIFSGADIRLYILSISESSRLRERSTSISCSLFAYGLNRKILSCAFLSLAAETIFMAEVICLVDLTELTRTLIAFKFAILNSFVLPYPDD